MEFLNVILSWLDSSVMNNFGLSLSSFNYVDYVIAYNLFLLFLLRFTAMGMSLLFIYDRMGVSYNWRALIPFVGFKPMFDYAGVPFYSFIFCLIPKYGFYIFITLMIFGLIHFCNKIGKGYLFCFGCALFPDVFLPIIAFDDSIKFDYKDELEELRLEILRREKLNIE